MILVQLINQIHSHIFALAPLPMLVISTPSLYHIHLNSWLTDTILSNKLIGFLQKSLFIPFGCIGSYFHIKYGLCPTQKCDIRIRAPEAFSYGFLILNISNTVTCLKTVKMSSLISSVPRISKKNLEYSQLVVLTKC